jgi:hypothetical protein
LNWILRVFVWGLAIGFIGTLVAATKEWLSDYPATRTLIGMAVGWTIGRYLWNLESDDQ